MLSEPDRIRFFKMLGIEPPAKTPITFGRFPKIIKGQSAEAGLELVRDKPWSARRFPSFAKWLAERETLLDLAVEASQRPRCYLPLIRPATSEMANDLPLAPVRAASTIAEALVARATLRLNEGKTLEASQDLLACHRLARLVGSGPPLMDSWIGLDLKNSALHGDSVLLQSGKLSAADALAYRDELRRLRPAPSVADHFDRGERLLMLAFMTETFRNVEAPWMKWTFIPILHNALKTRFAVVWNAALRGANTDWDRWARRLRTPNAAERRKQIEMLEAESQRFPQDRCSQTLLAEIAARGRAATGSEHRVTPDAKHQGASRRRRRAASRVGRSRTNRLRAAGVFRRFRACSRIP